MKKKHKTNNEKIAKSRIKLGLILNEYGERNNLKVSDTEVREEIQKQIKGMPGQEKMILIIIKKSKCFTKFEKFYLRREDY